MIMQRITVLLCFAVVTHWSELPKSFRVTLKLLDIENICETPIKHDSVKQVHRFSVLRLTCSQGTVTAVLYFVIESGEQPVTCKTVGNRSKGVFIEFSETL